jgi:hypothetical protein
MRSDSLLVKCFYALLFFIVGYFYFIHLRFSYNFPYNDEYRTISTVIIDYVNADGFWGKLKVLFVNENESLQLFLKLAIITFFEIFGEIKYNYLAYIGQISLLGFPLVIYLLNKKSETLWFDIGLAILIIFNLQYYVLSFKHDVAFYYLLGLLGVTFSLFFWVKGSYKLAVLFFLVGIFNNSSSVLVLPVFFLDYITSAKNIKLKYLLYGLGAFVLIIVFFYLLYPYLFWLPEGWEITTKALFVILGILVEFKYGFVSAKPYLYFGPAYLVFILFTFSYYFFKSNVRTEKSRFYVLIAMYFFVTILVLAVKRSHLFHIIATLLDPRYKIFPFSLLLFLILLWDQMLNLKKMVKWGIVLMFLLYNVFYMFDSMDFRRFLNQGAKLNSIALKEGYDIMGPTHINYAVRIYNRMDSIGIAPGESKGARELHNFMDTVTLDVNKTPRFKADVTVSRFEDMGHYHTVQRVVADSENKESYLFLKSKDNVILFPIDYYLKNSRVDILKTSRYWSNTFHSNMFLSVLKEGEYYMGLVTKEKKGSYLVKLYPEKTIIDAKVKNLVDEVVE